MQPRAIFDNLNNIRVLAHMLYCQCSELSGPYETASNHLRLLQDTIEVIYHFHRGVISSPEIAALDKAICECERVLNAVDHALGYQDRQPLAVNETDVKFTARISLITKKLINAHESVVHANDIKTSHEILHEQPVRPQDSLDLLYELDESTSAISKSQPQKTTHGGIVATAGPNHCIPESPVSSMAHHRTQMATDARHSARPPPTIFDSWKAPFAVADPMSNDIETASYLILAEDTNLVTETGTANDLVSAVQLPLIESAGGKRRHDKAHLADLDQSGMSHRLIPHEKTPNATKVDSVYGPGDGIAKLADDQSQELVSNNLVECPSRPQSCTTTVPSESSRAVLTILGQREPNQEFEVRPKYRIVNTNPSETLGDSSDDTIGDDSSPKEFRDRRVPMIPRKNSRRTLRRNSLIVAQNRKARVFDWNYTDDICPESQAANSLQKQTPPRDLIVQSPASVTAMSSGSDSMVVVDSAARLVQCWNSGDLGQAELHLEELLKCRPRNLRSDVDRRVEHLMGVIASLKGRWEQALLRFSSVLNTPLINIAHVDDADCAAAYWMGDIYMLFNRRTEAIISYSIAKQGVANFKAISNTIRQRLLERLQREQEFCHVGNEMKKNLDHLMQDGGSTGVDSMFNPNIMTRDTARKLLELVQWPSNSTHATKSKQSRAMAHSDHDLKSTTWRDLHSLQLSASALSSSAPWPMLFDPLFAIGNISCGLSLSSECDLLKLKTIPRTSGTLSRKRLNCFTCQDLHWLIITLRECLERLQLKCTEVANTTGTRLILQYTSTSGSIASTHFISISIFRLTIRSGFGVDICPGGIFSSRIPANEAESGDDSGHAHELKRIKRLIRSYLDAALRRQEALEDEFTVVPVMSINCVTSIQKGTSWKGKKRQSQVLSSPASSSRSGFNSIDSIRT